jgi:hypothetical protein
MHGWSCAFASPYDFMACTGTNLYYIYSFFVEDSHYSGSLIWVPKLYVEKHHKMVGMKTTSLPGLVLASVTFLWYAVHLFSVCCSIFGSLIVTHRTQVVCTFLIVQFLPYEWLCMQLACWMLFIMNNRYKHWCVLFAEMPQISVLAIGVHQYVFCKQIKKIWKLLIFSLT